LISAIRAVLRQHNIRRDRRILTTIGQRRFCRSLSRRPGAIHTRRSEICQRDHEAERRKQQDSDSPFPCHDAIFLSCFSQRRFCLHPHYATGTPAGKTEKSDIFIGKTDD
jgi:hypothetical protein